MTDHRVAALKAHQTMGDRPTVYQQHILDTADFYDVVPEAPPASTLTAAQANYWKSQYTLRKKEPGAWPATRYRRRS